MAFSEVDPDNVSAYMHTQAERPGAALRGVSKTLDMWTNRTRPNKESRSFVSPSRNFVPFAESWYLMFEPFSGHKDEDKHPVEEICGMLGVGRSTL